MLVHATELLLGIMWFERVLFAHIAILYMLFGLLCSVFFLFYHFLFFFFILKLWVRKWFNYSEEPSLLVLRFCLQGQSSGNHCCTAANTDIWASRLTRLLSAEPSFCIWSHNKEWLLLSVLGGLTSQSLCRFPAKLSMHSYFLDGCVFQPRDRLRNFARTLTTSHSLPFLFLKCLF